MMQSNYLGGERLASQRARAFNGACFCPAGTVSGTKMNSLGKVELSTHLKAISTPQMRSSTHRGALRTSPKERGIVMSKEVARYTVFCAMKLA